MFNNNRLNLKRIFYFLLASLLAPSAYAYQFGPPPITELAEAGGSQNRLSLYSQSLAYEESSMKLTPTLQGISFVSSTGDRSGSGSGIFRLAQYKDNRTVYSAKSDSTGFLIGTGYGAQWYLGEQRNLGLMLNGQFDFLVYNYDLTTNSTITNSQPALGLEAGMMYRIFIDQATITPFVSAMAGIRARTISYSDCSSCGYTVNYKDQGTTIGVDLMWGRFSASALQTKASYTATANGITNPDVKSTTSMIMLGMNF